MQHRNLSLSLQVVLCGMSVAASPMVVAQTTVTTGHNNEPLPTTTLDTIVVTASSGGITPTVNQQVVEKSNIVDMKDVLKDQPSLSVSGGNGVAQQLYMRNFGENELTFSVDNTSTNTPIFHHQSRFMFDPALLKSMSIEKGTGQANSGISVTAGAIRMTTVDANDMLRQGQNVGAMIGGGYSSNKGYRGVGAAYGRSSDNRFDGIVMGNNVQYENYKDGDGNEVPNTKMNQQAYMAKLGWNVNADNRLEVSHRREQIGGDLGFRPNLIGDYGSRHPKPSPQPIMDTTITQDTTNLVYHGYDVAGREGVDVTANAYYSQSTDKRQQIDNIDSRFPQEFDIGVNTKGANTSVTIPISIINNHSLETGINYRQSEVSSANFTVGSGQENKTETGVYAQMNWDFNPFTLSTGVRYDQYDITNNTNKNIKGDMVSPSVAARWQMNDNFAVNGSWSQAMQSPRLYDALILGLSWANKHDFVDNLKPGKAQTAEVGVEWRGDNGFMADANVFDQTIKDYIAIPSINRVFTQTNSGNLKNRGYEVNVGYRKDGVKAYLGMSHSESKLNDDYYGFALDIMPTGTKYNASVSYQFNQPRLEIGVKNHYVSDFSYQEKDDNGKLVQQDLDSYWITDIFANWQPLATDNLSINASVNNVADQKYYNQSNFRTVRFTNNNELNPEKGREFRVGVNYKF